jgi:hypothetical protein
MVSMTLMSMVALTIHYGFRLGLNAWAKADRALLRVRETQSIFDLMSRQLGSMVPHYSKQKFNDTDAEVLLYQGTESGMRFVSTFSFESRNSGGMRLVEYFFSRSGESNTRGFIVNETVLPGDEELAQSVFSGLTRRDDNVVVANFFDFVPKKNSLYLIHDIDTVQFRYFEQKEPLASPNPLVRSLVREQLPAGVEIKLHWDNPGIFSYRDLSIVVPMHAG